MKQPAVADRQHWRMFIGPALLVLLSGSALSQTAAPGTAGADSRPAQASSVVEQALPHGPTGQFFLAFRDEFAGAAGQSGPGALAPGIWNSGWFTQGVDASSTSVNQEEPQWYGPAGIEVSNGALHLRLTRNRSATYGKSYRSGMVTSHGHFALDADTGRWVVEVRAQMPADMDGEGLWPALWLLSTDNGYGCSPCTYPPELDVFEFIGSPRGVSHFHTTGGDVNRGFRATPRGLDPSQRAHTYTIDMSRARVTMYLDGRVQWTTEERELINRVLGQGPLYLLLNLAALPRHRGPDSAEMTVGYVRAWHGE